MSGIKKAGLLILLLAFPAFFFVFLKFFGTNHYDLPYFHPKLDSLGNAVLTDGDTVYYQLDDFLGIRADDDSVSADILRNSINVFLFASEDAAETDKLKGAIERLVGRLAGSKHAIQYIVDSRLASVSFPEANIVIDNNRTEGSRLDWKQLFKMDTKDGTGRTFSAGSSLILVDGQRRVRGYYDIQDAEELDRAIAEIKILEYQYEIEK